MRSKHSLRGYQLCQSLLERGKKIRFFLQGSHNEKRKNHRFENWTHLVSCLDTVASSKILDKAKHEYGRAILLFHLSNWEQYINTHMQPFSTQFVMACVTYSQVVLIKKSHYFEGIRYLEFVKKTSLTSGSRETSWPISGQPSADQLSGCKN